MHHIGRCPRHWRSQGCTFRNFHAHILWSYGYWFSSTKPMKRIYRHHLVVNDCHPASILQIKPNTSEPKLCLTSTKTLPRESGLGNVAWIVKSSKPQNCCSIPPRVNDTASVTGFCYGVLIFFGFTMCYSVFGAMLLVLFFAGLQHAAKSALGSWKWRSLPTKFLS